MTEENYKKALDIQKEISELKIDIRKLNTLIKNGVTKATVKISSRFYCRNAEFEFKDNAIGDILQRILKEKELKLEELKKEFESL